MNPESLTKELDKIFYEQCTTCVVCHRNIYLTGDNKLDTNIVKTHHELRHANETRD